MNEQRLFFEGVAQKDIFIRGQRAKSPAFYRDVGMMLAIVTVDLKAAQALMPAREYSPVCLWPGRALLGINCFEYRDTDVGPYNEVSLALAVRMGAGNTPGFLSVARSLISDTYHAYILHLPVNTEIALHGGVDIFNYPKYLADIRFDETESERNCRVLDKDSGELIYAFKGKRLPCAKRRADESARKPNTTTFFSYPLMNGKILRAMFRLNQIEFRTQWFGQGIDIAMGSMKNPGCSPT